MECTVRKQEDYRVSKWTGGTTRQLAIFPEESSYLDRTFVWRLSSATCELDESKFSKLPDFDRILIVLQGSVVLAHENQRVAKLAELEQDSFDGAWKTTSFGQITDYNLMVRKGNRGMAEVIELSDTATNLPVETDPSYGLATQAVYVRDGFATVTVNGNTHMVRADQQLVVNYEAGEKVELSVMGEGHIIRCQIFYNYHIGDFGPVKVESAPASASDFKECMFIARNQFRFSKYISKRLKNVWFDEALQAAIRRVNTFYLTEIVLLLGFVLIAWAGLDRISPTMMIILFIIWAVIDFLLVSPLIFFLFVPKPVSAHIKDIDKLTPYEQKVRERQLKTNERTERLLARYKITGTAEYDENGNRIDDYKPKW